MTRGWNVLNSSISYLGYNASVAYGLSWDVVGTPGPNNSLYNLVQVYGNIENDKIQDNYYGIYALGFQGGFGPDATLYNDSGEWTGNTIENYLAYGIDARNASGGMFIQGNTIQGNGGGASSSSYAYGLFLSHQCSGVTINDNSFLDNVGSGLVINAQSDNDVVTDNTLTGNGGDGITISDSYDNQISGNVISANLGDGLRFRTGAADNVAQNNQIFGNKKRGVELLPSSGTTLAGGTVDPDNNTIEGNQIYDNVSSGVRLSLANQNSILQNVVYGNGSTEMTVSEAVDNVFSDNSFVNPLTGVLDPNMELAITGALGVPSSALVSNEPSLPLKLDQYSTATFSDALGRSFKIGAATYPLTTVTPAGSTVTLNHALLGGTKQTITTLPLNVAVASSAVTVQPVVWTPTTKQFDVRAATAGVGVILLIGDRTPGAGYDVYRNGIYQSTLTASASGQITFSDELTSTVGVQYEVVPTGARRARAGRICVDGYPANAMAGGCQLVRARGGRYHRRGHDRLHGDRRLHLQRRPGRAAGQLHLRRRQRRQGDPPRRLSTTTGLQTLDGHRPGDGHQPVRECDRGPGHGVEVHRHRAFRAVRRRHHGNHARYGPSRLRKHRAELYGDRTLHQQRPGRGPAPWTTRSPPPTPASTPST